MMETEQMAELAGGRITTSGPGVRRPVQVVSEGRAVIALEAQLATALEQRDQWKEKFHTVQSSESLYRDALGKEQQRSVNLEMLLQKARQGSAVETPQYGEFVEDGPGHKEGDRTFMLDGVGFINYDAVVRELSELRRAKTVQRQVQVATDSSWTPPAQWPPQLVAALTAIGEEFFRAKTKHGDKCIDGPDYSDGQRLAILVEEAGEVSDEVLNAAMQALIGRVGHQLTYDAPGGKTTETNQEALGAELVQVGAMAAGWLIGVQRATSQPQTAQEPATATRARACCLAGLQAHPAPCVFHGSDVC